jgi:hypothetical protein
MVCELMMTPLSASLCFVVGADGQRVRDVGLEDLHARSGQGENLHVDARGIHGGNALLAEIREALNQRVGAAEVAAPLHLEARIVEGLAFEKLAIAFDHFLRHPRLFGRDALVGHFRGRLGLSRRERRRRRVLRTARRRRCL